MTEQTWKSRVIAIVVFELRVISRCLWCRMSEDSLLTWQFVTRVAVWRQRCELALLVVTREAQRVSLASSLLQLEHVGLRRLRFIVPRLMTIGASCSIGVFIVREVNAKLRNRIERCSAKTRKRASSSIEWSDFDVTVRTDPRRRPLTREELLSMTIQTRRMRGKFGDVRKRGVTFADLFPVCGGKLMTGVAREFLFADVSRMREVCVIDPRTPLCVNRHDGQSEGNDQKCS